ncbi:MAG: hypothetical protein NZL91_03695 [Thermoflexales bacterium]|nr:hypothetical protein [Thermoflexales bacterium]MDW8291760.1 inositol monophosphatase family protein [Anaerolineae bacterium]
MELERFWEDLFSEETLRVRRAWRALSAEEQSAVRGFLARVSTDETRIVEQRRAAAVALQVIEDETRYAMLPLPEHALHFARALARQVGLQLKAALGQAEVTQKHDGTLLTPYDLRADATLRAAISEAYPDHAVLSEESEHVWRGQEWCWVIDPIDGTTNFAWGLPTWGVLIALLHRGVPVLGVAEFPLLGEQYSAVRGIDAWLNGAPIRVLSLSLESPKPEHLFACCTRSLKRGMPDVRAKLRVLGSTAYNIASVARGACVGSFDLTVHVWDVAAVWPLIVEAGGFLSTSLPQPLFPLRENVDYSGVEFSVLAACSLPMHNWLAARFELPPLASKLPELS